MTANQFIYSKSATARILNVSLQSIKEIRVWRYVIWIHIKGQKPTMISKKLYKAHFVQFRKNQAAKLQIVWTNGQKFRVFNYATASSHIVDLADRTCTCNDFATQSDLFGSANVACKHIYAALNYVGYNSLSDFIAA